LKILESLPTNCVFFSHPQPNHTLKEQKDVLVLCEKWKEVQKKKAQVVRNAPNKKKAKESKERLSSQQKQRR
jgi:hypothetical protein